MNHEMFNYSEEQKAKAAEFQRVAYEMGEPHIKDSGNRRTFAGGGVRDMAEGKGACWLMPLDIIAEIYAYDNLKGDREYECYPNEVFIALNDYIRNKKTEGVYETIINYSVSRFGNLESALLSVAVHYEMGSKKYKPRNWELIGETDTFVDSAIRHYLKCLRGDDDEPHDRAFLWNLLGLLWTDKHYIKDGDNNDRDSES